MTIQFKYFDVSTQTHNITPSPRCDLASQSNEPTLTPLQEKTNHIFYSCQSTHNPKRPFHSERLLINCDYVCERSPSVDVHNYRKIIELLLKIPFSHLDVQLNEKCVSTQD